MIRACVALTASCLLCFAGCSSSGGSPQGGGPSEDSGPGGDASSGADVVTMPMPESGPTDAAAEAMTSCPKFLPDGGAPSLFTYELASAAFPDAGTPSVAVHVPAGFDPSNHPGLLVFFHGFDNCVTNVVGSVDTPCVDGGPARVAMHLVDQVDAARINAILVAVELELDMPTGNPGQLAMQGDFRALLHELFTQHLDPVLGCPLDVDSFDPVVVSSHSGGYWATASVLAYGEVPAVREVDLLDSLYGERTIFDDWVMTNLARFVPSRADRTRWMTVYTETGGTAANSRTMATDVQGWLDDAGLGASELFDDTTDTLDAASYAHPVIFKLTDLTHDQVPQYYVGEFARASGFTFIP